MAISKIILDGEVQMDVTQDTVAPNYLLAGYTATAANGEKIEGNIATKTSSNITVSGATVTIPSGYYASQQTKTVASGSAGTPVATKGTVSNNSVSVTPKVTNTTGYISGGTKTGSAVTVSASELVSGIKTITNNGQTDVTNYKTATVNVQPNNQDKTITPSQSQQIVNADSGYTGLGTVTVTAMPTGTVNTPTASKGTVSNHSVSVTPNVTTSAGYITSGTKVGNSVTVSASELVSGSQTLTYNQTYDVTNLASVTVDVEGGGVPINNQTKTVSPSLSQQTITYDSGYTGLETVTVDAMPIGTEGTPVADVQTNPSNEIFILPTVTNTEGYITGGTRVGEPVTINPGVTTFNGQSGDVTYTAPVTSVNGQTGAVVLTIPATPSAYVTAKGSKTVGDTTWTYRKWSDNTYECWGAVSYSMTIDEQWGNHYYKSVDRQSYPVTFTAAPFEQATVTSGSGTLYLGNDASKAQTTTKTAGYLALRPAEALAAISFIISYYVKGTVSS